MPRPLHQLRRRLRRSPLARPILGAVAGLALAGVALGIDAAVAPHPELVTVEAAQMFLSAVVGATITVTALLFWIRGMLVQLAAGQLSNRVMRWYLEDRFLLDSIGFLIAVFAFAGLQLLAMPAAEEGPAPPVGTGFAMVLTLAALVSIVMTITNSVHATDTGMVLHHLTDEARTAIRRYHPGGREDAPVTPETPVDARHGSPRVRLSVTSEQTGWVNDIHTEGLLDRLPETSMLEVQVRVGSFVTEGQALAHLAAEGTLDDADELERLGQSLVRCFTVRPRRDPDRDVEFSISRIVDVALSAIAPQSADRTSAFEAIRHLGVALRELYSRRLPPTHHVRPENRQVVLRVDLGYAEYLRRSFGQIREGADGSLPALGTLLSTLGPLRGELALELHDERLDAIDDEAARLIEAVRHSEAREEERRQILDLAARYGWEVPGGEDGHAPEAPPPSSPEDVYQGEPSQPS